MTIALVIFQHYVVKKTQSTAIEADSLHYISDILVNISIIIALILAQRGFLNADAFLGIIIAFYISYTAWKNW